MMAWIIKDYKHSKEQIAYLSFILNGPLQHGH